MGAFDGSKICKLVGCLLQYNLNNRVGPYSHGLYLVDGLIILDNSTPRKCDTIRKKLHRLFNGFRFKLEIQTNLKITDYLDITLNLYNETVYPFRKQNQNPHYVNMGCNHPTEVFKHIPNGTEHRLSTNSSNIDIFEQSKQDYEKALKDSGYNIKLSYKNSTEISTIYKRKNRPRRILWFTPQYNMEVVNKLGNEFFKLLKRNFPVTNPLHKIFYKNNIKLSYSCIPNINSIINKSNTMKLNK